MIPRPTYIASCSFGKDSIATILLALEHNEPLDRVVFSEVMFDHARDISGEIPEHIGWIYNTAIPKLHNMGVHVDVVRAERDYRYFFANAVGGGRHAGKIYGFPLGGKCFINRDCKIAPIRKYLAEIAGGPLRAKTNIVQYVGIAADEPRRLAKLTENRMSLLAKYGYTEQMAKQLCATHGLLSPIYTTGTRGGCWFCPNCKIQHFVNLRRNHPELWAELVELSHTPNLCSYGFKYGLTVQEIEKRMDAEEQQLKLF